MVPTPEELIDRARQMAVSLSESAQRCEDLRRVPEETVEAFADAGFYRISQPAAYGGFEYSPRVLFQVARELARGCPSSAWCACLIGVHNWEVGLMDPRAAQDLWENDDSARFSSSYAPFGHVEEAPGGWQVSGQWPWSSGCDHCQWAILGALHRPQDRPPETIALLVPRRDYEIVDTWFVAGLKGTGSKDIAVAGTFVPEHRVHHLADSYLLANRGADTFTAPIYRYPFGIVFGMCLSSVTLGIARAALDEFIEQQAARTNAYNDSKASQDPFVRQRLANVSAAVHANELRFDALFDELEASAEAGLPLERRVHMKWETQQMAQSNAEAVATLFRASGGSAVRLSNPMQRYFRDIHAAINHAFLNADNGSVNFGGVALGDDNRDFAL